MSSGPQHQRRSASRPRGAVLSFFLRAPAALFRSTLLLLFAGLFLFACFHDVDDPHPPKVESVTDREVIESETPRMDTAILDVVEPAAPQIDTLQRGDSSFSRRTEKTLRRTIIETRSWTDIRKQVWKETVWVKDGKPFKTTGAEEKTEVFVSTPKQIVDRRTLEQLESGEPVFTFLYKAGRLSLPLKFEKTFDFPGSPTEPLNPFAPVLSLPFKTEAEKAWTVDSASWPGRLDWKKGAAGTDTLHFYLPGSRVARTVSLGAWTGRILFEHPFLPPDSIPFSLSRSFRNFADRAGTLREYWSIPAASVTDFQNIKLRHQFPPPLPRPAPLSIQDSMKILTSLFHLRGDFDLEVFVQSADVDSATIGVLVAPPDSLNFEYTPRDRSSLAGGLEFESFPPSSSGTAALPAQESVSACFFHGNLSNSIETFHYHLPGSFGGIKQVNTLPRFRIVRKSGQIQFFITDPSGKRRSTPLQQDPDSSLPEILRLSLFLLSFAGPATTNTVHWGSFAIQAGEIVLPQNLTAFPGEEKWP